MSDDQSSFFGRFYSCGKQRARSTCKDACKGQKAFAMQMLERMLGREEKPPAEPCGEPKCEAKPEPPCGKPAGKKKADSCCFIVEQNPLAPCCCEEKTADEDEPCPALGGYTRRVPGCGCDLCRRSGYHGRCCGGGCFGREPPQFEKA